MKSKTITSNDLKERQKFLDVYTEFNDWLSTIGFRRGHYWTESTTSSDYHYSMYDKYIDALYGVEHYVHDILKFDIRILRDRNEHKILFVGNAYTFSEVYSLENAKQEILNELRTIRDTKLKELETLKNI